MLVPMMGKVGFMLSSGVDFEKYIWTQVDNFAIPRFTGAHICGGMADLSEREDVAVPGDKHAVPDDNQESGEKAGEQTGTNSTYRKEVGLV